MIINGDDGANTLTGTSEADTINGFGGDDTLDGGAGADTITGGGGNDTVATEQADLNIYAGTIDQYRITQSGTSVIVADQVAGRDGTDTLSGFAVGIFTTLFPFQFGGVDFRLVRFNAGTSAAGIGSGNAIVLGNDGSQTVSTGSGIHYMDGGAGNDGLIGNSDTDYIYGGADNDGLNGGGADDFLYGEDGVDTLDGGGGGGNDRLDGGAGDGDVFAFTGAVGDHRFTVSGSDLIVSDVVAGRDGIDTVVGAVTTTLSTDFLRFNGTDFRFIVLAAGPAVVANGDAGNLIYLANADADVIALTGTGQHYIDGGGGDDTLTGGSAGDALIGNGGNDRLVGGLGADRLVGGLGIDTVDYRQDQTGAAVTVDLAAGTASNGSTDTLAEIENVIGSAFADDLTGDGADNVLEGSAGADTMSGGGGTDTASYAGSAVGVTVSLVTGAVGAVGDAEGDTLSAFERLLGSAFADRLTGDAGANALTGGLGDDTLMGGAGADQLIGGDGIDTASYANATAAVVLDIRPGLQLQNTGDAAGDTFSGVERFIGSTFDDRLEGSDAGDDLRGDQGNDVLDGRGGNDRLDGGAGDDRLVGGAGLDQLDGQGGIDTADFSGFGSAVWVDLQYTGTANEAWTRGTTSLDTGTWREIADVANIENVIGTVHSDLIRGDGNDNVLFYTGGRDRLDGRGGTDTADFSLFGAAVWVDLTRTASDDNEAWTRDGPTVTTGTWRAIASLTATENLTGTNYADDLRGDGNANRLTGGAGDDRLTGRGGNDILDGGAGTDTAVFANPGGSYTVAQNGSDIVVTGEGTDTVLDTVELFRFADMTLTREQMLAELAPRVFTEGTDTVDLPLFGGTFNALGGDDVLNYRGGVVSVNGWTGRDLLDFSAFGSAVWVDLNIASNQGQTKDEPNATGSGNWRTIAQIADIDDLAGTVFNDLLRGNGSDNTFFHTGGLDDVQGMGGTDTMDFSRFGAAVWVNLAATGTTVDARTRDNTTVTSGIWREIATLTAIENLTGTNHADNLQGNATANRLTGGAGNDLLTGRGGGDVLDGGGGIDTASYAGSAASVVVSLRAGSASGGHAAGDTLSGIENLTGSDHADQLIGDSGDNVLTGGAGDDILEGDSGDDQLIGGAGIDKASYASATAAVTVDLTAGTGNDGSSTDTLTSLESVIGSQFSDTLRGDGAANRLEGQDGDDWLLGLTASDTLLGGNGSDQLWGGGGADTLNGGAGFDWARYDYAATAVTASLVEPAINTGEATGDTYVNIEGLVGSAFGDTLQGDPGANNIYGLDGNDTISGRGGDDAITGGNGNDTLTGGGGYDTFFFGAGLGQDTVTDFVDGTDIVAFDHTILADFAAVQSHAVQSGANTIITQSAGNTVTLQNVQLANLQQSDFLFY